MVNIRKLQPAWVDHRTDIPQWICTGIAYAVAEWAVLERELEELIRILMDGEIDLFLIRVTEPEADIRCDILEDRLDAIGTSSLTAMLPQAMSKPTPLTEICSS